MYEYNATLIRVIDGDTVVLDIDLGFFTHIHATCRLYGINAPEMRTPTYLEGRAAKQHLIQLLEASEPISNGGLKQLVTRTYKDREKYGRFLVEIYDALVVPYDWAYSINNQMVVDGYAVVY